MPTGEDPAGIKPDTGKHNGSNRRYHRWLCPTGTALTGMWWTHQIISTLPTIITPLYHRSDHLYFHWIL